MLSFLLLLLHNEENFVKGYSPISTPKEGSRFHIGQYFLTFVCFYDKIYRSESFGKGSHTYVYDIFQTSSRDTKHNSAFRKQANRKKKIKKKMKKGERICDPYPNDNEIENTRHLPIFLSFK